MSFTVIQPPFPIVNCLINQLSENFDVSKQKLYIYIVMCIQNIIFN